MLLHATAPVVVVPVVEGLGLKVDKPALVLMFVGVNLGSVPHTHLEDRGFSLVESVIVHNVEAAESMGVVMPNLP